MTARIPTALLLAALVALTGCGGGNKRTIPSDQGAILIRQLKKAEAAAGDPSQCPALARAVTAAEQTVSGLPSSVDSGTRDSLTNGVKNLQEAAASECAGTQTTPTTNTTPTVPTTNTTPTPPPTTNTQPTPPPTTNTQTTPPKPTPKPPPTPTPTPPGNGGAAPPGQQKKGKGGDEKRDGKPSKVPQG